MTKDFLNKNIYVGDSVVFMQIGYRNLLKGTVKSKTQKTVFISHERTNVGQVVTKQRSSQVYKINT